MSKYGIELEISSTEAKNRGIPLIGHAITTWAKHKNDESLKEKLVSLLLQELNSLIEKNLETKIYTEQSFREKFDSLYQEYSFDDSADTERKIRDITLEMFKNVEGIEITKCEAKYFLFNFKPIEIDE